MADQDGGVNVDEKGLKSLITAIDGVLSKGLEWVYPVHRRFADGLFSGSEDSLASVSERAKVQGWGAVFMQPRCSRDPDDIIVIRRMDLHSEAQ